MTGQSLAAMKEPNGPEPRFQLLFFAVVLLIVVYPVVESRFPDLQPNLLARLVLIAGAIRATSDRPKLRWGMIALAAAALPGAAFSGERPDWLTAAGLICDTLFLGSMVAILTLAIFYRSGAGRQAIYGAATTYLMIALAFGSLFQLVEMISPGSFHLPEWALQTSRERALFYFSFVTLTTLGYGDLTPLSDAVRSLAVLESIIGVLFPAIMITRLITVHTGDRREIPFEAPVSLPKIRSGASNFEVLFAALLIQIASYPYVPMWITQIVGVSILLAALFLIRGDRSRLVLGVALAIPAMLSWAWWATGSIGAAVGSFFLTLFLAFTAGVLVSDASRRRKVDRETLFEICCVYLLIGAAYSSAYHVLFSLDPGSLSLASDSSPRDAFASIIYLSYVTLTTLGYGDILPLSGSAQSLAMLESATGILFSAILIARLVSLYRNSEGDLPDLGT